MIPYLDRHLVYPLLNNMDPSPEITRMKFELLKETNMTDYVAELDAELRGKSDRSKEYEEKREKVLQKRAELEEETAKLRSLLEDKEVVSNLRSDKVANLNYLKENHGVTVDMVDALYNYGQFQYSCGAYQDAAELLYQFRVLSTDNDKIASATWGKLASEILSTEWDQAMEEIQKVKDSIDTRLFNNPLAQLQHRTWLIHWSLFPFFNHDAARDTLTELYFSPAYINTIQTLCPWILRYLTAAVITNRLRSRNSNAYQKQLKDLIRVVKQEGYEYSDPLTDFVRALYVDFDFEEARKKLELAEEILKRDFFLGSLSETFVDSARFLISEAYCKIHARIDIGYVYHVFNFTILLLFSKYNKY
jgi:translation initiation factor 3 subunit E